MKIKDYIDLHMNLKIRVPRTYELNPLPSETDPTQDIPVSKIELAANGTPLNVSMSQGVFSNLKPDNFTNIEKRNHDKFDVLNEFQKSVGSVSSKKGITTNYIKPDLKKTIKINENES